MTESLYDKCVDEHGVVDFARSGGMSNQKQSKKFLRALNEQCDLQKKDCFTMNVSVMAIMLQMSFLLKISCFSCRIIQHHTSQIN
jgi:hypothetical protein